MKPQGSDVVPLHIISDSKAHLSDHLSLACIRGFVLGQNTKPTCRSSQSVLYRLIDAQRDSSKA